jgi:uncharacterized membrane protein
MSIKERRLRNTSNVINEKLWIAPKPAYKHTHKRTINGLGLVWFIVSLLIISLTTFLIIRALGIDWIYFLVVIPLWGIIYAMGVALALNDNDY